MPLSFWLVGDVDSLFKKFVGFVAFLPLILAIILELNIKTRQDNEQEKGSPENTTIAVILGIIILIGITWIIFINI